MTQLATVRSAIGTTTSLAGWPGAGTTTHAATLQAGSARHDDRRDEPALERRELLLHYVAEGPRTIDSVDQLGNFLMGFGVLALGYLLQAELRGPLEALRGARPALQVLGGVALACWGAAVLWLVAFVHTYVTRVLAGRSVHAEGGNEDKIGRVLELPAPEELAWRRFAAGQASFEQFLRSHYRAEDRAAGGEGLLYARWTYLRFMALHKLAEMARMRRLLARALVAGVGFQILTVLLAAA
jgi:hypothetical protein